MSIPGAANPLLLATAAAGGYSISRSLRFNAADSSFLSRTPASAGNRKTWTFSTWLKKVRPSSNENIFATNSTDGFVFRLTDAGIIRIYSYTGSYQLHLQTSAVYRDTSAWYHFVLTVDTTSATAANRARLYVNGVQVTAFSTAVYPSQNADLLVNQASRHDISSLLPWGDNAGHSSFYLADIHFIDGQALDPTSFGEFSATTGVWMPKAYTGSYGTNGFRLTFADNSAATATTLGKDAAGSNNWTPNNLSVTAGAGNDSLVDVPTNGAQTDTGVGGEVRGNYATLNPLDRNSSLTLSNGNLQLNTSSGNFDQIVTGTIQFPTSGKWYYEVKNTSTGGTGANGTNLGIGMINASGQSVAYDENGRIVDATNTTGLGSFASGDTLAWAYDADNAKVFVYKNGSLISGLSASGHSVLRTGPFLPRIGLYSNGNACEVNFGQRQFAYASPAGFKALNTANLPAPVITKPSDVMDVVLYSGDGSSPKTVSGLNFTPDLVWIKSRTPALVHGWFNTVVGANRFLDSSSAAAEYVNDAFGYLSAFNSNGFTLTAGSSNNGTFNFNGGAFAAWCWDAGSSTVTNTAGSITSQVRANASAGFSIVTYTASSANATIGHGLGVAPSLVISKRRNSISNWLVQHRSAGVGYLLLNSTNTYVSNDNTAFNDTLPTSTVFSIGTGVAGDQVAYCFAPVAGYSSFGRYTGNGSTDGPFVYTGFRPRWLLIKRSDGSGVDNWVIWDAARNSFNVAGNVLFPNQSSAEGSGAGMNFLSNGFKFFNDTGSGVNASGGTYVWAAFAESPFQYARAR